MALAFAPHTVQVAFPGSTDYAEVKGMLYPLTPEVAANQFGVDVRRPQGLLISEGDASAFEQGGRVTFAGRVFGIAADPAVYRSIGAADNALILLEEAIPGGLDA